jgi:hypothetical protein
MCSLEGRWEGRVLECVWEERGLGDVQFWLDGAEV